MVQCDDWYMYMLRDVILRWLWVELDYTCYGFIYIYICVCVCVCWEMYIGYDEYWIKTSLSYTWNMYTWCEFVEYVYLICIRGICILDMNTWNMYTWYEYAEYVQRIWTCENFAIDMDVVWYLKSHDRKMWLWYMWKDKQLLYMRNDDWYMHDMRFMYYMTDSKEEHEKIWICITCLVMHLHMT